jgi:hypothetical protein
MIADRGPYVGHRRALIANPGPIVGFTLRSGRDPRSCGAPGEEDRRERFESGAGAALIAMIGPKVW